MSIKSDFCVYHTPIVSAENMTNGRMVMRISGVTYVPRNAHKARRMVITILVLMLVIALAIVLISAYIGWEILHPPRTEVQAISSNIAPEFDELNFTGSNKDITLNGWYFKSKSSSKTIILAHDYGSNRLQFGKQTFDMIKDLMDNGYNVLTFDFRNSGKSEGDISTLGYYEKDDLLAAVARAKSLGSKQTILMGFSAGASASIIAGAQSGDVAAVIADNPFSDLNAYIDSKLILGSIKLPAFPFNKTVQLAMGTIAGIDTKAIDPAKAVSQFAPRPLLLIYTNGSANVYNSSELYDAYPPNNGKIEMWEVKETSSAAAYTEKPREYMEHVFKFLSELN